jgi:flagellar export protein FliJ
VTAHLRNFVFPLQPLLQRSQWRLDAVQTLLGHALGRESAARAILEHLRRTWREASPARAARKGAVLDAMSLMREREYLSRLYQRIEKAQQELRQRIEEREACQSDCLAAQQQLEAYKRCRESKLKQFVDAQYAVQQTQTDHDWVARLRWRDIAAKSERV